MRLRKFIPPMSIVLFLALTLAGTYYVRRGILEKHITAAMDLGDNAAVAELANSFPSPLNARDRQGRTPLHWAVERGDRALVELLISRGADLAAKDGEGHTPWLAAMLNKRPAMAELLRKAGAKE